MIITARIPVPYVVVLMGKRTPECIHVWERMEVLVREISPNEIAKTAELTFRNGTVQQSRAYAGRYRPASPQDPVSLTYFRARGIDAPLFRAADLDEDDLELEAYHRLFGLRERTNQPSFDEMPAIRSLVTDHSQATRARVQHFADQTVIAGNMVLTTVEEPFLEIMHETHGNLNEGGHHQFHAFRINFEDRDKIEGAYDTFRLTDIDAALGRAREMGATDADIELFRSNFDFQIQAPELFKHDAQLHTLLAAANELVECNRGVVHRLTWEQMASWAHLRDAYPAVMSRANTDIQGLAEKTVRAYEALRRGALVTRNSMVEHKAPLLRAAAATSIDELDAEALSGPRP